MLKVYVKLEDKHFYIDMISTALLKRIIQKYFDDKLNQLLPQYILL